MKIKSVAVLGAGAVGSYVIWGLSEKSDVRSMARLTIRKCGLRMRHMTWI